MTALVADRNTSMKDAELISVPMAATTKIFAGSIVCVNAAGYATKGAATTGLVYLGRAEEMIDNTTGSAGFKSITVRRGKAFKYANEATDPVTQASLGKSCYIFDDQTVCATAGGLSARPDCGRVIAVDVDGVWVINSGFDFRPVVAPLAFASITPGASADLAVAYPGAAIFDPVTIGFPASPPIGLVFNAFVSAVNVVTVRASNITAAAIVPAAQNYTVTVQK